MAEVPEQRNEQITLDDLVRRHTTEIEDLYILIDLHEQVRGVFKQLKDGTLDKAAAKRLFETQWGHYRHQWPKRGEVWLRALSELRTVRVPAPEARLEEEYKPGKCRQCGRPLVELVDAEQNIWRCGAGHQWQVFPFPKK